MKERIKESIMPLQAFITELGALISIRFTTVLLDFLYNHWYSRYLYVHTSGADAEMYNAVSEIYEMDYDDCWIDIAVRNECERYMEHDFKRSFDIV